MRDPEYRRWLREEWCILHLEPYGFTGGCDHFGEFGLAEAAHTQNNGLSSKGPDSSCVPLCRKHHREYDGGRAAFEKKYGVDMKALAKEYYARFLKEKEQQ